MSQVKKEMSIIDNLKEVNEEINQLVEDWCKLREGINCYPLLVSGGDSINRQLVDEVFDDLRSKFPKGNEKLDVILHSGGGNIDSAYNLSLLFRKYGKTHLQFIVPRWAKSAATLLVCSGDKILMTPVAELGPLDPQITEMNPIEGRLEQFSPLHIDATMNLIRNEYNTGNEKFGEALLQRLQFPLTLGKYTSYLDIGKEYVRRLLSTRMLKNQKEDDIDIISDRMTTGFSDHGYCLNSEEAKSLGLLVEELSDEQIDIVWSIHKKVILRERLQREQKKQDMQDSLKDIPSEILDKLPKLINKEPDNDQ